MCRCGPWIRAGEVARELTAGSSSCVEGEKRRRGEGRSQQPSCISAQGGDRPPVPSQAPSVEHVPEWLRQVRKAVDVAAPRWNPSKAHGLTRSTSASPLAQILAELCTSSCPPWSWTSPAGLQELAVTFPVRMWACRPCTGPSNRGDHIITRALHGWATQPWSLTMLGVLTSVRQLGWSPMKAQVTPS